MALQTHNFCARAVWFLIKRPSAMALCIHSLRTRKAGLGTLIAEIVSPLFTCDTHTTFFDLAETLKLSHIGQNSVWFSINSHVQLFARMTCEGVLAQRLLFQFQTRMTLNFESCRTLLREHDALYEIECLQCTS